MRVYVASALSNAADAQAVAEALALDGWKTTYPWWTHGSVQAEGDERIREVAKNEIEGVLSADLLVVVLPGGRGTHVELGIAIGRMNGEDPDVGGPQRILIFGRGQEAMKVRLTGIWDEGLRAKTRIDDGAFHDANGGICAFYMAPGTTLVEKDRGTDGLRLEALRAWREIQEGGT